MSPRGTAWRGALAAGALALAGLAEARAFLSRAEALELAFPGGGEVRRHTLYLSRTAARGIEHLARAKLATRVIPYYEGTGPEGAARWAFFDTHAVRTLTETLLIVVGSQGRVEAVEVVAFHEPEDFLPARTWLESLEDRALDDELRIRRGVRNVSGATLTARAVVAGVRRTLAIWEAAVAPGRGAGRAESP